MNKKSGVRYYIRHGLILVLGAALVALSLHMFILPASFAPGGVTGLSSIIQTISNGKIPAGYAIIALNAPLLILAFCFLGKRMAVETLCVTLLSSGFTELYRLVNLYQFTGEHLLAAIAGGVITGAGIGILVRVGASSGGTDIVGLLIQKRNSSLSVSWLIFAADAFVAFLGGVLYLTMMKMDTTNVISVVLFSFITMFLNSKTIDIVLNGFNSAVKFEVITSKPKELAERIIAEINRGVTIIESRGAFTNTPNNIVLCVVRSRQIPQFRRVLKSVDSAAFAFATNTREVLGNGFNDR